MPINGAKFKCMHTYYHTKSVAAAKMFMYSYRYKDLISDSYKMILLHVKYIKCALKIT